MAVCFSAPTVAAELAIDGPTGCVTADDVSFRVERALGQALASTGKESFRVRVASTSTDYLARLEATEDGRPVVAGARELSARSCEELTQAIALAIALALGTQLSEPEPSPTPSEPPVLEPPLPAAPPSEDAGEGPVVSASASLIGDTGTLPVPSLGVGIGLVLGWQSLELRIVGTVLPRRAGYVVADDPNSPGVDIGLLAGGLLACVPVAVDVRALRLGACAGGEVGDLSGSGTGVSTPYHHHTWWSAVRLDVVALWAIAETPLALELLLSAAAPLRRDEFILRDIGSVHQPANVLGRAGLGLSVSID
jgi:hypothetical protein